MKNNIYFLLSFMLLWGACDIIEFPYVEATDWRVCAEIPDECEAGIPTDPFDGVTITRKVLLEEYTGLTCVNCPDGAAEAHRLLEDVYKGQMVLVSIHGTSLAKPEPAPSKYTADFRTDIGNELVDEFGVDGIPVGGVNRRKNSANLFVAPYSVWEGSLRDELALPVEAGIILSPCYDSDNRQLTLTVDVKYLVEGGEREHISIFITEDGRTSWQKNNGRGGTPIVYEDYEHVNMLRSGNGTWGIPLKDTKVAAGDIFREQICYNLPVDFNPANCKVVAIVHDFDTKIVRQAEEVKLVR